MSRKVVKCIMNQRIDLSKNMPDPFIRRGQFYKVVNESIPIPGTNTTGWIEVQCPNTGETYQRPRYMFGQILE